MIALCTRCARQGDTAEGPFCGFCGSPLATSPTNTPRAFVLRVVAFWAALWSRAATLDMNVHPFTSTAQRRHERRAAEHAIAARTRALFVLGLVMDRRFFAQALEIGPVAVVPKQLRVGDIDLFQRNRPGAGAGLGAQIDRTIAHGEPPRCHQTVVIGYHCLDGILSENQKCASGPADTDGQICDRSGGGRTHEDVCALSSAATH